MATRLDRTHHVPQRIPPLTSYDGPGYSDTDRSAALVLRTPLLPLLYGMPPADRAPWLAALLEGLQQGVTQGVEIDRTAEAYSIGQRMALLLTEEGHA
ncbi:hypothetical protein [Streptomyces canus]|uniref:hypothetical protein n=1 Tax=Streptomyces canus TaxID=58343 RepID=UPI0036EEDCEC